MSKYFWTSWIGSDLFSTGVWTVNLLQTAIDLIFGQKVWLYINSAFWDWVVEMLMHSHYGGCFPTSNQYQRSVLNAGIDIKWERWKNVSIYNLQISLAPQMHYRTEQSILPKYETAYKLGCKASYNKIKGVKVNLTFAGRSS